MISEREVAAWRDTIRRTTATNYHIEMGVAIARQGDADAALQHFRAALDHDPGCDEAFAAAHHRLQALGRADEAAALAAARAPHSDDALARGHAGLGQRAVLRGSYQEALASFGHAASHQPLPPLAQAWRALADAAAHPDRPLPPLAGPLEGATPDEALELAETALGLAQTHLADRPPAATGFGRMAATLCPDEAGVLKRALKVFEWLGASGDVARWIPAWIEAATPDSNDGIWGLGLLLRLGLLRHAETLYAKVSETAPGNPTVDAYWGTHQTMVANYGDAITIFARVFDAETPAPWMHAVYGLAHLGSGAIGAAEDLFRQGLARNRNANLAGALCLLDIARGNAQKAEDDLRLLAAEFKDDLWVQGNRAVALLELGRDAEARALFRASAERNPQLTYYCARLRPWRRDEQFAILKELGFADPSA